MKQYAWPDFKFIVLHVVLYSVVSWLRFEHA